MTSWFGAGEREQKADSNGKQGRIRGGVLPVLMGAFVLAAGISLSATAEPMPGSTGRQAGDIAEALAKTFNAAENSFVDVSKMHTSFWEDGSSPEPGLSLSRYCLKDEDFQAAAKGAAMASLYAEYLQQAFRMGEQGEPEQSFVYGGRYDRVFSYMSLGGRYFLRFIALGMLDQFEPEIRALADNPETGTALRVSLDNLLKAYPLIELLDPEAREDFYQDLATHAYYGVLPEGHFVQGMGEPCMTLGFQADDLRVGARDTFMTMPSLEVVYLSFWVRRFHEGNAETAHALILRLQEMLNQ